MDTSPFVRNTIILCAGTINYSNLPIGTAQSNAMVPVNGKPVIGWILDDLLRKGITDIVVVLRREDHRLHSFLARAYKSRMSITITEVGDGRTILHSLESGLIYSQGETSVRLILGDTLIRDPFNFEIDSVYVGRVKDARRWCLIESNSDGFIQSYIDKPDIDNTALLALAGYYYLTDRDYLLKCVKSQIAAGKTELSSALEQYGMHRPIRSIVAAEWYDFGSIDNLVQARQRLLQSRHFNSLEIDPVLGTVTKRSDGNETKLLQELRWYLKIPDRIKILTPRILEFNETVGQVMIKQEYYGYPTLAELSLYSDLSVSVWRSILARVFEIHDLLCGYEATDSSIDVQEIYTDKTFQRIENLKQQDDLWERLLSVDTLYLDGRTYRNLPLLENDLRVFSTQLSSNHRISIIHGDFCFSNILFDMNNQVVRLIDPRGAFGIQGIYGDPRYDVAKLRHSISGFYDHIVADMFDIRGDLTDGFWTEIYVEDNFRSIGALFDEFVKDRGYDIQDIRFIEALLFVSMVPLHRDNPKRQLIMYLTGIRLLNEVYECASSST